MKKFGLYRDTELGVTLTSPSGRKISHYGFYDGKQTWKIHFRPDENRYREIEYSFSGKEDAIQI